MQQYIDLINHILQNGERTDNRTGVDTISVFGYQMRFDMKDGFPLMTCKRVPWKPVVSELLWFLEGSSDERRLAEILSGKPREELRDKTTIWTANADNQGRALGYENTDIVKQLGPIYGVQWRNWNGVDQIQNLIDTIKNDPSSRRMIVSAWNVEELPKMALPPCHTFFQCNVQNGKLNLQLYQRSADVGLGIPFNIASYSLLLHMLALETDLEPGEFVHTLGDAHIYENHIEPLKEMLKRPLSKPYPKLEIIQRPFFKYSMDDFKLIDYDPHPTVKLEMAV